jgi:hypothetical protein
VREELKIPINLPSNFNKLGSDVLFIFKPLSRCFGRKHPTSVWVLRIAVHSNGGSLLSDENPAKQTLGMLTFLILQQTLNMVDLSRMSNGSGTSLRMPDKIMKIEFKLELEMEVRGPLVYISRSHGS